MFCCDLLVVLLADLAITFGYHPVEIPTGRTLAAWQVDGICLPATRFDEALPLAADDVPVLGTEDDIAGIARLHDFQAVALLPSSGWTHSKTRRLSWELERTGADLLMAPVLMDPVGPRRYSLDELPQLFNVVTGDMSLVGPRPPLECEVVRYGEDGARRRLFVKPGLTGLWQVSGRSNLSWGESVRADPRYVENWTFALDLSILRRTLRAVLHSDGAY